MTWLNTRGFTAYYHDINSKELISSLASIEKIHNTWISYACVRITRTNKTTVDETFHSKENRIFIRKDDKFIEFDGRFNRDSKLTL